MEPGRPQSFWLPDRFALLYLGLEVWPGWVQINPDFKFFNTPEN